MNRRELFKFLAGATTAAVAAHFGAPEWMGEEIRQEVAKDLLSPKVSSRVPGEAFDNRPVWTSVSGVRQVWVDHVAGELARQIDRDLVSQLSGEIDRTVSTMVRAVDRDLEVAKVEDGQKIIIETPRVRLISKGDTLYSKPTFELKAGLEKAKNILGDEKFRVGYLAEQIIVPGA